VNETTPLPIPLRRIGIRAATQQLAQQGLAAICRSHTPLHATISASAAGSLWSTIARWRGVWPVFDSRAQTIRGMCREVFE
jgi:hypothetical protein